MTLDTQLTIVIPCKNEGYGIQTCLQYLDSPSKHPELQGVRVIISDSSDDTITPNIIERASLRCKQLRVETIRGGLPAVARNAGGRLVTTPFVLFLDADILVEHPIRVDERYDLTTHRFCSTDGYHWVYRAFDVVQWLSRWTTPFCLGGFMLFRTSVFWTLGGFNSDDKFAEDYHLSSRVSRERFCVYRPYVYTSARRFRSKGVCYMIYMMILTWWYRNDSEFFKKDHGYWS